LGGVQHPGILPHALVSGMGGAEGEKACGHGVHGREEDGEATKVGVGARERRVRCVHGGAGWRVGEWHLVVATVDSWSAIGHRIN